LDRIDIGSHLKDLEDILGVLWAWQILIMHLGKAISNFVKVADQYTSEGPKTSYNVGVISGGTSINSIPFESVMQIDIRSIDPKRLDAMEALLQTAVQEALVHQNNKKTVVLT